MELGICCLNLLAFTAGNGQYRSVGHGKAVFCAVCDLMEVHKDTFAGTMDIAAGGQQFFHGGVVGAQTIGFPVFHVEGDCVIIILRVENFSQKQIDI